MSIIVNFLDIVKFKFSGNRNLIKIVKDYYCDLTLETKEYDFEIKVKQVKDIDIKYKEQSNKKSFTGGNYFKKDNFCYYNQNKIHDEHLIIINDNKYEVYITNSKDIDVIIKVSREILCKKLLENNYIPIHSAVVEKNDKLYLFFGERGKGKSTLLFSSVIFNKCNPVASDLAFIKKNKDYYEAVGFPLSVTISEKYFDLIKKKCDKNKNHNNKIKFTPKEFCEAYKVNWKWSGKIDSIINVNLIINKKLECNKIKQIDDNLMEQMIDNSWSFDEVFYKNDKISLNYSKYNCMNGIDSINKIELKGELISLFDKQNNNYV